MKARVILIDPPWPSGSSVKRGKWQVNMRPRYQTLRPNELLQLPVSEVSHENSVLFLWSTWMHLNLAMKCIESWGFKYCTGMPWLKVTKAGGPHFGVGIWFLGCSEIILVAKRGKVPNPRPARKGIIVSRRGEHSEKPGELRQWIDANFTGPKLELFARQEFPGWDSLGDAIDGEDIRTSVRDYASV